MSFPWPDGAPLRGDAFMAAALHDPERGYYARRITGIGRRGDFTTTPTIAPAMGKAVAAWAVTAMKETGVRHLIELGPGEGLLSEAVLRALPWWTRRRVKLHLVERSVPLRERQRARLGRGVEWHEDARGALAACGGRACLFSNEFVDAFPARSFRRLNGGWDERWIGPQGDEWRFAAELPDSRVFEEAWPAGQVVEIHEAYHTWLQEILPLWRSGRMMTIDYGAATAADLYHRRPRGTLRGYFHHQLVEGDERWKRPGHQDLTTDVLFADLVAWSAPRLATRRLIPQAEFLVPFIDPSHPGDRHAADPAGAGRSFLCLDQEATA